MKKILIFTFAFSCHAWCQQEELAARGGGSTDTGGLESRPSAHNIQWYSKTKSILQSYSDDAEDAYDEGLLDDALGSLESGIRDALKSGNFTTGTAQSTLLYMALTRGLEIKVFLESLETKDFELAEQYSVFRDYYDFVLNEIASHSTLASSAKFYTDPSLASQRLKNTEYEDRYAVYAIRLISVVQAIFTLNKSRAVPSNYSPRVYLKLVAKVLKYAQDDLNPTLETRMASETEVPVIDVVIGEQDRAQNKFSGVAENIRLFLIKLNGFNEKSNQYFGRKLGIAFRRTKEFLDKTVKELESLSPNPSLNSLEGK